MKHLNSALIILMMVSVPTVQAHAENLSIESAMNELSFALTVQWDQKDPNFKTAVLNKFMDEVADLQSQGVTKDAIIQALRAKLPDAQMAKDADTLFQIVKAKNLSPIETNQLVTRYLAKSQTSGASYSSVVGTIGIGLGVVAGMFLLMLLMMSGYTKNG